MQAKASDETPYRTAAADIAESIPKAPWKAPSWLGPLALVIVCCIAAGGSFDVAIRTGYWGVCIGAAVASITLLITGLVILSQEVKS